MTTIPNHPLVRDFLDLPQTVRLADNPAMVADLAAEIRRQAERVKAGESFGLSPDVAEAMATCAEAAFWVALSDTRSAWEEWEAAYEVVALEVAVNG
ncbi:MAG: hypothetical protein ACRDRL_10675 [Sciscionella sp.]